VYRRNTGKDRYIPKRRDEHSPQGRDRPRGRTSRSRSRDKGRHRRSESRSTAKSPSGDRRGEDHSQPGKGPLEEQDQEAPPVLTEWDVPIPDETEGPGTKQEQKEEGTIPQTPGANLGREDTEDEVRELVRIGTIIVDDQGNQILDYREELEVGHHSPPLTAQQIEDAHWADVVEEAQETAEEFATRGKEEKLQEQVRELTAQSAGHQKAISKKESEVQWLKRQAELQGRCINLHVRQHSYRSRR
jgi:hypothetical protein